MNNLNGAKSVIAGIVLIVVGVIILVPIIKYLAIIIILILGGWFIIKGLQTVKK